MKIINNITLIFFLSAAILSCKKKEIKSEKGGIDIISNVYLNSSKGLDKMQSFHVSRLNYIGDTIIEIIPDLSFSEINTQVLLIKDSLCYELGKDPGNILFSDVVKNTKPKLVYSKNVGAIFSKDKIPNYRNKKKLSDTVLFKKNYKRFEINSPWNYTRFYVYQTDTILPYSIYPDAGKDFGGRIERIDSYNKKKDIFVSLQLIPRKNLDMEAKEIFDFNEFAINRKIK